jgi:hypothetical protein
MILFNDYTFHFYSVTKMMRVITPERVAKNTVEAVKNNKESIVVPESYRYIFYALG